MKIIRITDFYPEYISQFYNKNPELHRSTFIAQKKALLYDSFGWFDAWSHQFKKFGYEADDIFYDVQPLQKAWALENDLPENAGLQSIALAQLKKEKPDILWFDLKDEVLLNEIRNEQNGVKSIKKIIGWVGSAFFHSDLYKNIDLTLSCAQESVERLRSKGCMAAQLHHAFDPRVLEKIHAKNKTSPLTFIGSLVRKNMFHLERELILEKINSHLLKNETQMKIYTPAYNEVNIKNDIKFFAKKLLNTVGLREEVPFKVVNKNISKYFLPPIFGIEMYQAIHDTKVSLNIHADSSPRFASNMRLFESTGVGTCLLTDHRSNLSELFEVGTEVVEYNSAEDCAEKVKWLLENESKREAIALAGQKRTFKDHTFEKRTLELFEILKKLH